MISEGPAMRGSSPHEHYVRAVVAELGRRGIAAADVEIVDEPLRHASVMIAGTSAGAVDATLPDWVRLGWTERHGWSWQARYGDDEVRRPVYFAVALVPPPEPLVTWLCVALRHPGVEPTQQADAPGLFDLEAALHGYTALDR